MSERNSLTTMEEQETDSDSEESASPSPEVGAPQIVQMRRLRSSMSVPLFCSLSKMDDSSPQSALANREKLRYMRQRITAGKVSDKRSMSKGSLRRLCPHRYDCVQNACLKGFLRTFSGAFIAKALISVGTNVLTKGLSLQAFNDALFSADTTRFSLVLALMSFLYKSTLCSLRHYFRKNHRAFYAVAGAMSATAIALHPAQNLRKYALFGLVRAMADVLTVLSKKGVLPKVEFGSELAFIWSQVWIVYSLVLRPKLMGGATLRWMSETGGFQPQKHLQQVFRHGHETGQFKPCVPHIHEHSHLGYLFADFWTVFARVFKLCLPAHLMQLMLSPERLRKNLGASLRQKLKNAIRSSLFLANYFSNGKVILCTVRSLIQSDPTWLYVLQGLSSGASIFIEDKKRRAELALYCLPRALEIMLRLFRKEQWPALYKVLRSRLFAVFHCQLAVATWMMLFNGTERRHLNSINETVLTVVFGSRH